MFLNISFKSSTTGAAKLLPYPIHESQPILCWELPEGVVQKAYCVELKSRFPTTLSDGTTGYAYYNSSKIESDVPEHQVVFQMFQNVWAGIVEVRIRLYGSNDKLLYSTHESTDKIYDFEEVPQYYRWDSTYDGYYFLFDQEIENIEGTVTPTFQWTNVEDEDEGQTLSYQLQWSLTPLFLEGALGQTGNSHTRTVDVPGIAGAFSYIATMVDVKAPVFYRVRAFDGLDYSEWSEVNGYFNTPTAAPYFFFNWVISNCTSSDPNVLLRPDGEVEISFRVVDLDTPIVSAYLTYRLSTDDALVRKPCSLDSSTVSVPSNTDITVSWHSARQLPNQNVIVFLYGYAYDGYSQSYEVAWESTVTINNTGIGFGYSDSTDDVMTYRFLGKTRNYERWLSIPEEKADSSTDEFGNTSYRPKPIPEDTGSEANQYDWAGYWASKLREELEKYQYSIADNNAWHIGGKVMRAYYSIYDGFDDGKDRLESGKLFLEYKDEFESREKDEDEEEEFVKYYEIENGIELGRGISSITYFVKPPMYGPFRIRRPLIVHAGNSGLYMDGEAIDNKPEKIMQNSDFGQDTGKATSVNGKAIEAILGSEFWKNFYQFDPLYDPEAEQKYAYLGTENQKKYDKTNEWYWTLFEYTLEILFPFSIRKDVNDRFKYRWNGIVTEGSILPEGTDTLYISFASTPSEGLTKVFKALFPEEIFQSIENGDITAEQGKYIVKVYSKQIDSNRTFQFVKTDADCYRIFGLDMNIRFSKREKSNGTKGGGEGSSLKFVISQPYEEKKNNSGGSGGGGMGGNAQSGGTVYEVSPDTGDSIIGVEDEINSTEPLFTCDPVHVNQYGCHYKYTRKRYLAYRKVFIRKYFVRAVYLAESDEPLRDKLEGESSVPTMGFRNYKLKYAGKNSLGELLFTKEYIPGRIGGKPAVKKLIPVVFENQEFEEYGWWLPNTDLDDPSACISHEYNEDREVYFRLPPEESATQIGFQDCLCTEYVEMNEGWEKPFFDYGLDVGRIDLRHTLSHSGMIPQGYIQYVMGAYKPPAEQEVEISPYDAHFSSVVKAEEGYNTGRYMQNWDESGYARVSEKQGTVVDPMFIEPGGAERSMEKWGYQPDLTLETYFKLDKEGIWKDRIIPKNNSYVHGIYRDNDISFRYVEYVHLFRRLVSDTSKVEMPETEGVKVPYIDYRFIGGSPLEARDYYSAMPLDESPYYEGRPPEVYREDRPTRITGFIDSMSVLIPWKIIYLQTEWNSYNLIHWEGAQDESVYAKLEVSMVSDTGSAGNFMTLHTKNAEWFPKFSCWLIPFVKLKQSDYIDTLNGTFTSFTGGKRTDFMFEENKRYRFRVSGVNIHSGATNTPVLSSIFTYSKDAYSPPIITNLEYNKWTHEFCIEFRFDDVRGRKYDIINFYYATYDPNDQSPPDSEFIEMGVEDLTGELIDLASNTMGDDVISEAYLIKHKLYFSSDILQDFIGKNIRFRLECIASEDREGMTAPVFHFLMWGNEFLKKADEQIDSIVGKKNRWVYQTSVDENGKTVEQWVYLPEDEAVIVPGILTEQNNVITQINQRFEDWYLTVAKFQQPGFDALFHFIQIEEKDEALYSSCIKEFITQYELTSDWTEFQKAHPGKKDSYLEQLFIQKGGFQEDFKFFWDNRAIFILEKEPNYATLKKSFDSWFKDNSFLSREEAKPIYIKDTGKTEDYQKYKEENKLTDDSDDTMTSFLVDKSLQSDFETFYETLNNYPDGRYDDRKAFVEAHYKENFEAWKAAPVDAYENTIDEEHLKLEDEALRLFIAHDRNIWNEMLYTNAGKNRAKNYFLTVMENGVTFGQQLQTANAALIAAQNTLNAAYATRNYYETRHRRKLIARGYFSNGWKNNQVYVEEGGTNEPFRFRVENQPVSGKRASVDTEFEYDDSVERVEPVPGYDTRWDIYFHFQLDFYDSFDSQNGKPLRDYLWQRLDCSGYAGSDVDSVDVDGVPYIRIMGGIEAETGGMHVLPETVYTPNSGKYGKTPTTDDPYSFQFAGRFSLLKTELPGELESDTLPEFWNSGEEALTDDFNQVYFWRVCPYNLVKRPVMEREMTTVQSIEYFGDAAYSNTMKYWKAKVTSQFFGNHKYSSLLSEGYDYYYYMGYIWVAKEKLETPVWKFDKESDCWNSREAFYENFFPATDKFKADINDYTENPVRESYRARIERGEMVFLTDRPREVPHPEEDSLDEGEILETVSEDVPEEELTLQYIEAPTDHFKSLWIPFNRNRSSGWLMLDMEEKCWFLISQKHSKNREGYTEYVFTLGRGLSPQTFGEECQLFPTSTQESASSVLEGAQSFEHPCLLKVNGKYRLYFDVRKEGGIYEPWLAESKDLYDWTNFTQVQFTGEESSCHSLAVYQLEDGTFSMFCVQGTSSIRHFSSEDGITFQFASEIHGEMYTVTRPTYANHRIYFGVEFGGHGKVLSIDENGSYDTLKVEKGSPCDFENAISFNEEDVFFNPMVTQDFDKGTPILRMVYEKEASVYEYDGTEIKELPILERAFFTEFLEEYSWEKVNLGDPYGGMSSTVYVNGSSHPIIKDAEGNAVTFDYDEPPRIPVGKLEILFATESENPPETIKIPLYLEPEYEDTESEGEWLDYYNVGETEADLSPEMKPADYDPANYTTEKFILNNELMVLYDRWMNEKHPDPESGKEEEYRVQFLLESKQYSLYLKWSKQGPGIYRHVNAVKRTSYTGDGED